MLRSSKLPLPLFQVLEEEYVSLHGPIPADSAPPSSDRQWEFDESHLKSPDGLNKLVADISNGKSSLSAHLKSRLSPEDSDSLDDFARSLAQNPTAPPPPGLGEALLDALDEAVRDPDLHTPERFAHITHGSDAEEMNRQNLSDRKPVEKSGDRQAAARWAEDRRYINRLLLEEAYPDALKRIGDIRLAAILGAIHRQGPSALCFSGGGIRSGTFALGVLQALAGANAGYLDKFDYLSTVSGGGYIGGWLTAWIHRHPEGLDGVIKDLNGTSRASRLEPEPEPLRHLRDYSNFITPRTGLLSADTWTFVTIYIRNLLLNWTVMIPLLLSVLMIPRVVNAVILSHPGKFSGVGSFSAYIPVAFLILGTLLSGWAIAFMRLNRPSNSGALRPGSFWAKRRNQRSFLRWCFLPLSLSALLLTIYWAWLRRGITIKGDPTVYWAWLRRNIIQGGPDDLASFALFGLALGMIGGTLYLAVVLNSWRGDKEKMREAIGKKWQFLSSAALELLITLVVGLVAAFLLWAAATNLNTFASLNLDALTPYADGSPSHVLKLFTKWYAEWYTSLAVPVYMLVFFLGTTLFVGVTSRRKEVKRYVTKTDGAIRGKFGLPYLEDEDREWMARFSAWLFIAMIGWSFFSALVIFGPLLLFWLKQWLLAAGGLSGLLTILGGQSAKSSGAPGQEAKKGWKGVVADNALTVASFVFLVFVVILLSLLTSALIGWLPAKVGGFNSPWGLLDKFRPLFEIPRVDYAEFVTAAPADGYELVYRTAHYPTVGFLLLMALALHLLGRFMARLINLNEFSLHAGYRNRLIRAFLGASRLKGERQENPFTGFDPRDNLHMHVLRPGLLSESDFKGADAKPAPDGLTSFVNKLKNVEDPDAEPANADAHLRRLIKNLDDGQSEPYFADGTAEAGDASFRSAFFADLNFILQTASLDDSGHFKKLISGKAERARALLEKHQRGDYRILLNRLLLERAYGKEIEPSAYPPPPYKLLHVVNMTLNLVGGDRLAWQQRKAETFTSSPLHAGNFLLGYRRARDYGGSRGIKLGTAVAVSGAAANSNMGYFSASPAVTFVMTLFNVRLGWWLGNPGVAGYDTFHLSHPRKALSPVIDEAFGLTDDRNEYVLLSDGGHFENLGLYEMVLRRCRTIIAVDGSSDPEGVYDDLGSAVRKIRIDMGINIEFKPAFTIYPRSEKKTGGGYCAIGTIYYEDVDGVGVKPGRLIYIKPAFYGQEPRDVYNYARGDLTFPHETTADQFFDEPQFESHRMLGYYIIQKLFRENLPGNLAGEGDLEEFASFRLDDQAEAEAEGAEDKGAKDNGAQAREEGADKADAEKQENHPQADTGREPAGGKEPTNK